MKITDPNLTLPQQDIAAHVEAVRAGMNAVALDMLTEMINAGVENAPAALLSGMLEAATQMWTKTMLEAGLAPLKVRTALIDQVKTYHRKHAHRG